MTHFSLGGLRPVFDFRQQLRLDPDAAVRNPPGVGLRFPDQRFETGLQVLCRSTVETVVDLAGIDQLAAIEASQIKPVELVFLHGEAGNG